MTDNGADNPQGFNWGLPPKDPANGPAETSEAERRAAEQAAANRRANEQAAAAQAAALAAQSRKPAAPQQPAEPSFLDELDAEDDDDPFAIFTPPPTEATTVLPPVVEPPAAPWVPGAFTAQQPTQQPVQPPQPTPAADPFPPAHPTPPELVAPPELVLPPEPKWPLPAQGTGTAGENSWDQPTQATPYVDIPTEEYHFTGSLEPEPQTYPWDPSSGAIPAPDPALAGISDFYPAQPVGLPAPVDEAPQLPAPHPGPPPTAAQPAADFDTLFGDEQFKEYDDESLLTPLGARSDTPPPAVLPRAPMTKAQRTTLWVVGGVVAALALVGLFLFGTSLSGPAEILPPTAAETPGDGASQAPEIVLGPVAPGEYSWDELLGSECLEPYTSPWEKQYTVVDCASPHAAQMVATGTFDDEEKDAEGSEFPGVDALVTRAVTSCESRNVINYGKAAFYKDVQLTASVPANADEWTAGNRDYYCFATRESGDAFNGTIAKTPKA